AGGVARGPQHAQPPAQASSFSRVVQIQAQMSERAVELLALPEDRPCLLLDVGCGSGLSGDHISEEGHYWVGLDISAAMLGPRIPSCPAAVP
uniref:BUD23 methyltransferase n=1 Tax=Nothoprocta perdicaria TaxID=30464 RepID=A0A8C6Z1Y2_NOTPE